MKTSPETINFLLEQIAGLGPVAARKMFGEYGLFLEGKMIAIVCRDQRFVRNRPEIFAMLDDPQLVPPFEGSKPHLLLEAEIDDAARLTEILRRTAELTPEPKPKRRRS